MIAYNQTKKAKSNVNLFFNAELIKGNGFVRFKNE